MNKKFLSHPVKALAGAFTGAFTGAGLVAGLVAGLAVNSNAMAESPSPVVPPFAPPAAVALADPPSMIQAGALIGQVWDQAHGRLISLDTLAYRLSESRWVLLGERHDAPSHHQAQARLVAALAAAGRKPAVILEMVERPQQDALDALRGTNIRPSDRWNRVLRWEERGWPSWPSYQPIFTAAFFGDLALVAGNLDRDTLRRQARNLPFSLPAPLVAAHTQAVVAGHCNMIPPEHAGPMVNAQAARDRSMAQAMIDSAPTPGDGAVLIAGAVHVRQDSGVPWHLAALGAGESVSVGMIELAPDLTADSPVDLPLLLAQVNAPSPIPRIVERAPTDAKGADTQPDIHPYDYILFTAGIQRPDPCEKLRQRFSGHQSQQQQ